MPTDVRPRHAPSHVFRLGLAAGLLLLVAVVPGTASSHVSHPECMDLWGEARYRNYGYDHIVHVSNRCEATAMCDISTNVNPTVQRVTVLSKQQVDVLTFRGSPSRDFVPIAECWLASR